MCYNPDRTALSKVSLAGTGAKQQLKQQQPPSRTVVSSQDTSRIQNVMEKLCWPPPPPGTPNVHYRPTNVILKDERGTIVNCVLLVAFLKDKTQQSINAGPRTCQPSSVNEPEGTPLKVKKLLLQTKEHLQPIQSFAPLLSENIEETLRKFKAVLSVQKPIPNKRIHRTSVNIWNNKSTSESPKSLPITNIQAVIKKQSSDQEQKSIVNKRREEKMNCPISFGTLQHNSFAKSPRQKEKANNKFTPKVPKKNAPQLRYSERLATRRRLMSLRTFRNPAWIDRTCFQLRN